MLAVGLKQLGHEAMGVRRDIHHLEQRQIAQPETAVKLALRKIISVLHREVQWMSELKYLNLLDFTHK